MMMILTSNDDDVVDNGDIDNDDDVDNGVIL